MKTCAVLLPLIWCVQGGHSQSLPESQALVEGALHPGRLMVLPINS